MKTIGTDLAKPHLLPQLTFPTHLVLWCQHMPYFYPNVALYFLFLDNLLKTGVVDCPALHKNYKSLF